jgi:mRNA interferase RelE/StbE
MYEILYSKSAQKALDDFPKLIQQRIYAMIERARIRPHHHFKRLVGEKAYSLRAGNYKILADINDAQIVILVLHIGHRRKVYD